MGNYELGNIRPLELSLNSMRERTTLCSLGGVCSSCNEQKPIDKFKVSSRLKLGHSQPCKKCCALYTMRRGQG